MRTKLLPLLGFVLFLTAVSCTDQIEVNPNYNPETDEVNAQFVFNISTAAPETKQTADATQATTSSTFRGISNGILLTKEQKNNSGTRGGIMVKDADMDKEFNIANAVDAGSITESSTKRIYEWSLPLKTDVALFYGKAPQGNISEDATYTVNDYYGKLASFSVGKTNGSTDITLMNRLESKTQLVATEKLLSSLMTSLMAHKIVPSAENTFTVDGFSFNGANTSFSSTDESGAHGFPTITWKSYYTKDNTNELISPLNGAYATPLEIKLGNAYHAMMDVRDGELRAASGEAILRTIRDLWTIINEIKCGHATSEQEAMAKHFALELHERFDKYFNATVPTDGGPVQMDLESIPPQGFKSTGNISSVLVQDIGSNGYWPAAGASVKPSSFDAIASAYQDLLKFPFNFNLPRGAVHMKIYNQDANSDEGLPEIKEVFYYPDAFDTSSMGTTGSYNAEDYYYPPELIYFTNSPLRTSDKEFRPSEYPGDTQNGPWMTETSWSTDWNSNFVKSSTRSVALKYEVNYGVALLKTQVVYDRVADNNSHCVQKDSDNNEYIEDNNHAIQKLNNPSLADGEEPNKKIYITENSFLLTGIIVGGQYTAIDWDCLAKPGTKQGFVYDKCIVDGKIGGAATYTLLFDTFTGTLSDDGMYTPAQTQSTISVALEFKNNTGADFYGNANLIRDGGYFYLIGALNPAGKVIDNWPSNHIVPPYKNENGGTSWETPRVFIQDFMTTATFAIGFDSLKNAYLTVPDLRSSSLTLGLSVDTKWSTGLSFDNIHLGE